METNIQKEERINRALKRVQAVCAEEHVELEPFLLIVQGLIVKKEINVVAKDLPQVAGPVADNAKQEGGTD